MNLVQLVSVVYCIDIFISWQYRELDKRLLAFITRLLQPEDSVFLPYYDCVEVKGELGFRIFPKDPNASYDIEKLRRQLFEYFSETSSKCIYSEIRKDKPAAIRVLSLAESDIERVLVPCTT